MFTTVYSYEQVCSPTRVIANCMHSWIFSIDFLYALM